MRHAIAALLIGGVPVVSLAVLWAMGYLAGGPAAVAILVCLASALLLAGLALHDVGLIADMLRQRGAAPEARPVLPPLSRIAEGIGRLANGLAARAVETETARRANDAIIDRLPDPLLLLGPDRSPIRSNAAARAAFGPDMAAVLRHPGLRTAIDAAFATGTAQTADLLLPVPVPRDVQASVIPLEQTPPGGGSALLVLSDRTRERAIERMRADFVANASHELRTPLASLIGFIETLRGAAKDDAPARERFLAIMAEQGARMHRLIDDLLSLSRIELSEHLPPGERVDLAALLRSVAAGFEPRLGRGRLVLAGAEGTLDIPGDADQLAQVFNNLVDNAAKYGRAEGPVRVTLSPPAGTRWPVRPGAVVSVADEGPGIPKAHLPRLTERFYRVDKARSRNAGGTGLGLAIVKHIVNRHRGQLAIDSEEGVGTTISVWLPLDGEGR